jgi:hypothetical protein
MNDRFSVSSLAFPFALSLDVIIGQDAICDAVHVIVLAAAQGPHERTEPR